MSNRKIIYSALVLGIFLALVLALIIQNKKDPTLSVYFLDVGQGDAILISQGQKQILIDGGPSGQKLMEKLGSYIPFWDRKIEVVLETHPDQDHIGGLLEIMQNYEIGEVIQSRAQSDSEVYKKLQDLISAKNIPSLEAEKGTTIKLAEDVPLQIILAEDGTPDDTNVASVVTKLTYGENTFLFTGDLPSVEEKKLVAEGIDVKANVLKLAHHGSKYSTSSEFLDAVKPSEAVISVAKNNRYGHPAPEILERLTSKGINILRTDEKGDIQFACPKKEALCQIIAR